MKAIDNNSHVLVVAAQRPLQYGLVGLGIANQSIIFMKVDDWSVRTDYGISD